MKRNIHLHKAPARWIALVLAAVGAATSAGAATSINALIDTRALTPQEKKDYAVTTAQGASGMNTIGIGQPAYLDALVNIALPAAEIIKVDWAITNAPAGSVAVLADSPLGTNVPPGKPADREEYQVAARKMLVPDVAGQYTVVATVETATSGTATVTKTINAGTYMGVNTCALCHSGGAIAENKVTPWSQTAHATFFARAIDGLESDHYGKNCVSCHVVGYDTAPLAVNGGFDDVATTLGWTFPAVLTNGNWAALDPKLKNLSNIQCENCHGPGSLHAYNLGDTSMISKTFDTGSCAQCHDSRPNHIRVAEWNNSRHAVAVREEETGCVGCHTGIGFAERVAGVPVANRTAEYEAITCAGCHNPHDATNPGQLRTVAAVTLMDNTTTITNGGTGKLCMNCHMTRRDAKTYVEITAGSNRFGPHHGPQADMLAGANAVTYGKVIPSSAHRDVVEDSCVTCHMQTVASTDPVSTHAGGHTFSPSYNGTDLTAACVDCHGNITSFDFPRQDYDGNGVVEGVQTEVRGLLAKLSTLVPPLGVVKTGNLAIDKNWTRPQLRAAYNYQYVLEDGSFGVHNLAWAVGLLKASIADLTGDSNEDGLPDAWQIQYFGSATSPNAAPNATPAGDGVPNWLKYTLGLDPTVPGVVVPNGVVWANGKGLVNPPVDPSATNTVQIFTAAEVAFNTEAGKTYQIQGASSLSAGWQNVGTPIPGTGQPVSYVTPTRQNAQQFYRVVTQ